MAAMEVQWHKVTADEWAEHTSEWRTYGTEPDPSILLMLHVGTKEFISKVVYLPANHDRGAEKEYYINTRFKQPKDGLRGNVSSSL
jgi:hypothetical protein